MRPDPAHAAVRCTRRTALRLGAGAAAALALPVVGPATAARAEVGGEVGAVLRQRIDAHRAAHGRPPLPEDPRLSAVAGAWSLRMAQAGGLSHNGAREQEYGWPVADSGEVVAYVRNSRRSSADLAHQVVENWMASGGHRAVLLGDAWTDIGIGWHITADGTLWATAITITADLPATGQEALLGSAEVLPDGQAPRIVIARADTHVDALAGASLVGHDSPLLLVRPNRPLAGSVVAEIDRVAATGATAYLVGGGLDPVIDQQLGAVGVGAVRLVGSDRYATAAAVARKAIAVRGTPAGFLLARGDQWADAVAVAGFAARFSTPVLLVDQHAVPTPTAELRAAHPDAVTTAVGGSSAIDGAVLDQLRAHRLAGEDRAGTAAAAMRDLWHRRAAGAGQHLAVTPGWTSDGWASALAQATWCARTEAPLLFASADGVPPAIAEALTAAGHPSATPPVVRFARSTTDGARGAYATALGT